MTTEPLLRLMIRSSRLPSSLLIARTRTLAAMIAPRAADLTPRDSRPIPTSPAGNEADVAGHGTRSEPVEVRAPRAGYLTAVDPELLMAPPGAGDSLIPQRTQIGDFVVTGALLADAWCEDAPERLTDRLAEAFRIQQERSVVQDIAFPIRQLADVAPRSVSPVLNDPTTAENAMGSLADTLVRYARRGDAVSLRVDDDGRPRFIAAAPGLNDLVRLGFEQVRVQATPYPTLTARLLALLAEIRRAAEEVGTDCREAVRQAELMGEAVADAVPTERDVETVHAARDRALDGAGD